MAAEPGSVDGLPVVYEFDPGSIIPTASGRADAGTLRGDRTCLTGSSAYS